MKLFISADIEGVAGIALGEETRATEAMYTKYARQMTDEVAAVCEAALEAGADEIVVKDGHGGAANIDPFALPDRVTLIRGKSGHPYNMMFGVDASFDGALFVGYHAPAGSDGSPLAHTSTGNTNYILLNGTPMSEFLLNATTAAACGVPAIFLSGDAAICDIASRAVSGIRTVTTKVGSGASAAQAPRARVMRELSAQVKDAVEHVGDLRPIKLPQRFEYVANYKDLKMAYRMSFYPGMEKLDAATLKLSSDRWMDVLTAHSFIVY